jgi:hypothetical protein
MRNPPVWLVAVALIVIGQDLLFVLLHSPSVLRLASVAVVAVLSWWLLRGSRVAWILICVSAAAEVVSPLTLDGPVWEALVGLTLLACLCVPSSWSFVWSDRDKKKPDATTNSQPQDTRSGGRPLFFRLASIQYSARRLIDSTAGKVAESKRLRWSLGGCCVLLVAVVQGVYTIHTGVGHDSVIVDVLWRVVWLTFNGALLAIIILLLMARHSRGANQDEKRVSVDTH